MGPSPLLDNFELLAETVGSVAKLRELVLQLAVAGKLVEQDAKDEPAAAFLDRVAEHKAIRENGRRSRGKTAETRAEAAGNRVLPSGWQLATFGEVVINRDGERIPLSKEIRSGRRGSFDYYGASGVIDHMDDYLFDTPLLLIGEDGANLINRSTPIAFIAQGKYWVNNHAHVLDGITVEFLRYLEMHINAIDLTPYVTGTAQPKMNQAKMNSILVAIPPEAEQRRIVAKVDQLLALCDELEARQQAQADLRTQLTRSAWSSVTTATAPRDFATAWQRIAGEFDLLHATPESVAEVRQAILQLAVMGELVEQDERDKPAEKLLVKLEAARRRLLADKRKNRRDELPPVTKADQLFDAPQKWIWLRFGSIADIVGGVTLGRKLDGRATESFPYLRVANVQRGHIDLSVVKEVVIPANELEKYRLNRGDILLTEGGDWDKLGRSAIWRGEIKNCLHQNHIFRARLLTESIRPEWITLVTNSPVGQRYFQDSSKQTTNLASINMTQLRHCPIPLPTTSVQDRTLARLTELLALCDRLEAGLAASQAAGEKLLASVVHGLLNGAAKTERVERIASRGPECG